MLRESAALVARLDLGFTLHSHTHLTRTGPFIAVHVRNGSDWLGACRLLGSHGRSSLRVH